MQMNTVQNTLLLFVFVVLNVKKCISQIRLKNMLFIKLEKKQVSFKLKNLGGKSFKMNGNLGKPNLVIKPF